MKNKINAIFVMEWKVLPKHDVVFFFYFLLIFDTVTLKMSYKVSF